MKPKRKELLKTINDLLFFIVSGRRYESRNPYSFPVVEQAMRVLAREQSIDPDKFLDVEIKGDD